VRNDRTWPHLTLNFVMFEGALCSNQDYDPEWWTADNSRYSDRTVHMDEYHRKAKRICAVCPVMNACAVYAINHEELLGVWGGTTDAERREIRRSKPVRAVARAR